MEDDVIGVVYVSFGESTEVMNGFCVVDALGLGLNAGSGEVNPDRPTPVQEVSRNTIARIVEKERRDIFIFFSTKVPGEAGKEKRAGKLPWPSIR